MIDRGLFGPKTNLNLIIYQVASDLRRTWNHMRLNDYAFRGALTYGEIGGSVKITDDRYYPFRWFTHTISPAG